MRILDVDTVRSPSSISLGCVRALALAACMLGCAACSSSSSGAGPTDGGGSPQGLGDGAGEDAPATSGLDAQGGQGGPDTQGGSDAGEDAGGGSQDGGAGDGGPCGAPGVVLCDDFEQSTIDTQTWTKLLQGNDPHSTLSLDPNMAKTGKQSLHSTISANAGQAMLSETRTFPMPMNKVYGRVYLNFGSPVIPDHTSIFVVQGTTPFNASDRFGEQFGNWFMNFISDKNPSEMDVGGSTAIATGSWLCVQWAFDGTASSFEETVDGVKLDATGADPMKYAAPTFSSFRIGMETYGGGPTTPAYDLWVDDVAIGTAPIDCLP